MPLPEQKKKLPLRAVTDAHANSHAVAEWAAPPLPASPSPHRLVDRRRPRDRRWSVNRINRRLSPSAYNPPRTAIKYVNRADSRNGLGVIGLTSTLVQPGKYPVRYGLAQDSLSTISLVALTDVSDRVFCANLLCFDLDDEQSRKTCGDIR